MFHSSIITSLRLWFSRVRSRVGPSGGNVHTVVHDVIGTTPGCRTRIRDGEIAFAIVPCRLCHGTAIRQISSIFRRTPQEPPVVGKRIITELYIIRRRCRKAVVLKFCNVKTSFTQGHTRSQARRRRVVVIRRRSTANVTICFPESGSKTSHTVSTIFAPSVSWVWVTTP